MGMPSDGYFHGFGFIRRMRVVTRVPLESGASELHGRECDGISMFALSGLLCRDGGEPILRDADVSLPPWYGDVTDVWPAPTDVRPLFTPTAVLLPAAPRGTPIAIAGDLGSDGRLYPPGAARLDTDAEGRPKLESTSVPLDIGRDAYLQWFRAAACRQRTLVYEGVLSGSPESFRVTRLLGSPPIQGPPNELYWYGL